ncbi:hypothetical protein D3C81_1862420 [compost metagenome]
MLPQAHQSGEFGLMAVFLRQFFSIALIKLVFARAEQLVHPFRPKQLMGGSQQLCRQPIVAIGKLGVALLGQRPVACGATYLGTRFLVTHQLTFFQRLQMLTDTHGGDVQTFSQHFGRVRPQGF